MRFLFLIIIVGISTNCTAQLFSLKKEKKKKLTKKIVDLPTSTLKVSLLDLINPFEYAFTIKADLPNEVLKPRILLEAELGAIYYSEYLDFRNERYIGAKTGLVSKFFLKSKREKARYFGLQARYKYRREKVFQEIFWQAQFTETVLVPRNINGFGLGLQFGRMYFIGAKKKTFIEINYSLGSWFLASNFKKSFRNVDIIEDWNRNWIINPAPLGNSSRAYFKMSFNFGFANW